MQTPERNAFYIEKYIIVIVIIVIIMIRRIALCWQNESCVCQARESHGHAVEQNAAVSIFVL